MVCPYGLGKPWLTILHKCIEWRLFALTYKESGRKGKSKNFESCFQKTEAGWEANLNFQLNLDFQLFVLTQCKQSWGFFFFFFFWICVLGFLWVGRHCNWHAIVKWIFRFSQFPPWSLWETERRQWETVQFGWTWYDSITSVISVVSELWEQESEISGDFWKLGSVFGW